VLEASLGVITASVGAGLAVHSRMMVLDHSKVFDTLLTVAPQWAWGCGLMAIGTVQMLSAFLRPVWRLMSLVISMLFWTYMAFATFATVHTIAPWVYAPLALGSFLTILVLAWEEGRVR
jgi:hypothetical protein